MTNNNGQHFQNGIGKQVKERLTKGEYRQGAKSGVTKIDWLFWTMIVFLEFGSAFLGVLYFIGLSTSGLALEGFPIFIYLLVGGILAWHNNRQPVLTTPKQTFISWLVYILGWPVRQVLRQVELTLLTKWEEAPEKMTEIIDFKISVVIATLQWFLVWLLVWIISISMATVLKQVWG